MSERIKSQAEIDSLDVTSAKAVENLNHYLESPEESVLREHQVDAIESIRDFLISGEKAGYISLPTGSGKTVLYTELAKALGLRTLILSPTRIILNQAEALFRQIAPEIKLSSYSGEGKDLTGDVLNTTYQSAILLVETGQINPSEFDLIIADEAHTALGEQRHKLWGNFRSDAIKIGLTATPYFDQLEGYEKRGLVTQSDRWTGMFNKCIHEMSLEEAMQREILVPIDVHMIRTNVKVSDVEITSGEYNKGQLERALNVEARNYLTVGMIAGVDKIPENVRLNQTQREEIEQIHQKIQGKRIAIFAITIDHADILRRELFNAGVKARTIHSKIDSATRKESLVDYKYGLVQVLVGVDALRIGWDSPETEVGIYLAPTKSGIVAVQELGRILRPSPESGKENAIAIQLVDEFTRRREAPILIPNIFDPYYVLRGTQTGLESRHQAQPRRQRNPITFFGLNIESIIEEAKSNEMLQTRFKQGTIAEIAQLADRLIEEIRDKNPDLAGLDFWREIASQIPRIPQVKQEEAMQAIASIDSNVAQQGRKALFIMSLPTAISAAEQFFTQNSAENEEILHTALEGMFEQFGKPKPGFRLKIDLYNAAQRSIIEFMQDEYGVPQAWLRDTKYAREIIERVRILFNPKGVSRNVLSRIVKELSEEFGVNKDQLFEYFMIYNDQLAAKDRPPDDFVDFHQHWLLAEKVGDVLSSLPRRERKVIEYHYSGFTLKETGAIVGLTHSRIGQLEAQALRRLRHPSRSRFLRGFYGMDEPIRPGLMPDNFADSRTLSREDQPRIKIKVEIGGKSNKTIEVEVKAGKRISWTNWLKLHPLPENFTISDAFAEWHRYQDYMWSLPAGTPYVSGPPVIHPDWTKVIIKRRRF